MQFLLVMKSFVLFFSWTAGPVFSLFFWYAWGFSQRPGSPLAYLLFVGPVLAVGTVVLMVRPGRFAWLGILLNFLPWTICSSLIAYSEHHSGRFRNTWDEVVCWISGACVGLLATMYFVHTLPRQIARRGYRVGSRSWLEEIEAKEGQTSPIAATSDSRLETALRVSLAILSAVVALFVTYAFWKYWNIDNVRATQPGVYFAPTYLRTTMPFLIVLSILHALKIDRFSWQWMLSHWFPWLMCVCLAAFFTNVPDSFVDSWILVAIVMGCAAGLCVALPVFLNAWPRFVSNPFPRRGWAIFCAAASLILIWYYRYSFVSIWSCFRW